MHKTQVSQGEFALLQHATYLLAEHLASGDSAIQTQGGRTCPQDLLNEAEKLLSKACGGMSLYNRLVRDKVLREQLLKLLKDIELSLPPDIPLSEQYSRGGQRKCPADPPEAFDVQMQNLPVQMSYAVHTGQTLENRWNEAELVQLSEYYGANPRLLEGFDFFFTSERQEIIRSVFQGLEDMCKELSVKSNCPHVNLLLGGIYKCRGVLDIGSTSTIISEALFDYMPKLKQFQVPISLGFSGVVPGDRLYVGILKNVRLQVTDCLSCELNIAVVPNKKDKFLLVGNNLMGGSFSRWTKVAKNDALGFLVLQNEKECYDIIQFIHNRELNGIPATYFSQVDPEPTTSQA